MAYIVTVQDPSTGARRRLEVAGGTTAEAIVESGRVAPGMRVLDVRPRSDADGTPLGDGDDIALDDAAPASPAGPDIASAVTDVPAIQWRRARRPILPFLATLMIGVAAGGAGAMWLTDGFDTLLARARTTVGLGDGAPGTAATPSEQPLGTVHATSEAAPVESAPVAAALPPETHRIADATSDGATLYRVISEDESTGYLYETLVRADTADQAASWCAARTRMEIVRVERVADAPR